MKALLPFVTSALISVAGQAAAQEVTLRVHHFLPPTAFPATDMVEHWCETIKTKSEGQMACQIYPAMQLGGTPAQLIDQARDGIVDAVFTVPSYQPGGYLRSEVFELPFIAGTEPVTAMAMYEYVTEHVPQEYSGVRPLWVAVGDPSVLHFKTDPVETTDELRGLKVRSPSRYGAIALEQVDALPVQLPANTITESLARGVIDGVMIPWSAVRMLNMHEETNAHTVFSDNDRPFTNSIAMFLIGERAYSRLPADLQAVIDEASGIEASRYMSEIYRRKGIEDREAAVERGAKIHVIDDAEYAEWVSRMEVVRQQWIAEVDKAGADGAALYETATALIAKYESQ
ncbi:TRAP transporter substrate-binding protein [Paracoccus alkenifer]|uniref:TRAP-type C4-dicarboxylate transport system, substrate-binding protein n=1 Tax=Paracoccus alkenifer TaxID=65735 RepID=A0A1H6NDB0_9RHOB|nr:TRAP transporter substrate-binding protein [Paracoccus alkenifer]SEI13123.1 TRAP-type C4-dicarboxylate transport system, substrate-binding protein [Paracoccus alkenifer]